MAQGEVTELLERLDDASARSDWPEVNDPDGVPIRPTGEGTPWNRRTDDLGHDLTHLFEPVIWDHPLMACVPVDGAQSIGTSSLGPDYLSHTRSNPELLRIHSTEAINCERDPP